MELVDKKLDLVKFLNLQHSYKIAMISLLGASKFDAVSQLGKLSVKQLITKSQSDRESSDESDQDKE